MYDKKLHCHPDRRVDLHCNVRMTRTRLNAINVSLPAKFCERTHSTWKTNTKKAFVSSDIRVNLKELHKTGNAQIPRKTYDSHNFRPDILFSFHGHQSTLGELIPRAKEADFLTSDWLTSNGSRIFKLCMQHS